MKYALLVYGDESWDRLPAGQKRHLHQAQRALHEEQHASVSDSVTVLAHYRLRPPDKTTTVRLVGNEIARTDGPSKTTSEPLRALYLLDTDDPDAAFELASRLPAIRLGGTAEIWPLIEPKRRTRRNLSLR